MPIAAGFGGVHEEFADDLGGVGNGDGVEVGVESAGDDETPEALDGAGGLVVADEPGGQRLRRVGGDRAQHGAEGAGKSKLVGACECVR